MFDPNIILKRLHKNGEFDLKVIETSHEVQISSHVAVRILDETGRKRVAIILDSETTNDEIKNLLPAIASLRDLIFENKKLDPLDFLYELLRVWRIHTEGINNELRMADDITLNSLTIDANFDALMLLLGSSRSDKPGYAKYCQHHLKNRLIVLNSAKGKKADDLINKAKEALIAGECPWIINEQPTTPEQLRRVIRTLRKKYSDLETTSLIAHKNQYLRQL